MALNLSDLTRGDTASHQTNLDRIAQTAGNLLKSAKRRNIEEAVKQYVTLHPPTKQMLTYASQLAYTQDNVLVLGETGTGKELIANILNCQRTDNNELPIKITPINCSGLTETLFESLVFGHKRGAFTGSIGDEPGLLRNAGKGTAFFDEVGELPPSQQAKLLRVLQTNKVRPVGDTDEYAIGCRFVFATHCDLKTMVKTGKFRADLYYRIAKFVLRTYPLRTRECDVMPIVERIYELNGWEGADIIETPPLAAYAEGNVRQLEAYLARREVLSLTVEEALKDL